MRSDLGTVARTVGALGLLAVALPVNLAVTGSALARTAVVGAPARGPVSGRTVLVSGGKMTKALALARLFHAAGHRVVLVEQEKYRLTGHRFSRSVDTFRTVPAPDAPDYVDALVAIAREESVDVYVPVCSPVASYHDARAKQALAQVCEVVHLDPDMVATLDDKESFSALAVSLGLTVPDAHRITDPQQVLDFDFAAAPGETYILKSIGYDSVRRLDLTQLPRETPEETAAFVAGLPISADNPWILQEMVRGAEYCTHSTIRDGAVQVYTCCESEPFLVNYAHRDVPAIEAWVRDFAERTGVSGQVSFDFMLDAAGRPLAIECNPRTHSAITLFHDQPAVAHAYLADGVDTIVPTPDVRPTYWIYHELYRLLSNPRDVRHRLGVILAGSDAIFDRDDPLPFLVEHHVQIPWLLLGNLRAGTGWIRIDFNIGKLVEPGGD